MLTVNVCLNTVSVNPDHWFNRVFDTKNLLTDFSKDMLLNVSQCEVISEYLVISKVLGAVPPEHIGTGVKAVLYMMYGENEFGPMDTHWLGNNLVKYIMDIGRVKDLEITTDRFLPLFIDGNYQKGDKVRLKNNGKIYEDSSSFADACVEFMGGLYDGR